MKCQFFSLFLSVVLLSTILIEAGADQEDEDDECLEIVLMGDMVFDGTIGDRIRSQGVEYPFEQIKPYILDADITLGNLETPMSDRGEEEVGKYCTFRSERETVHCLKGIGVDAVSLANNHCLDFGHDALNDTMDILEEEGIEYAGIWYNDPVDTASIQRPVILHRYDLKIGFLAYTEDVRDHWMASGTSCGPMPIDPGLMENDIKFAKQIVDILIVSIHWRKWPQYTTGPEESDRILCRDSIDWGADIIMGHGPHTVHEIEEYRDGLIFYSLGNSAMINGHENSSYSYIAKVHIDDGSLNSLELIPIVLGTYRYVPQGTPLTRSDTTGFNATYEDIWKMYDNDIYDLMDEEKGIREWRILIEESPWYLRSLLVLALILIMILIFSILYITIKRTE